MARATPPTAPTRRPAERLSKGHASTFSSGERDDIAWTYSEPEREVEPIRDRIAFYNEFVEIELDGEPQERPAGPFLAAQ